MPQDRDSSDLGDINPDTYDPMAQYLARSPFERQVEGGIPSGVLTQGTPPSDPFPERFINKVWKVLDQGVHRMYRTPYGLKFKIIPHHQIPPVNQDKLPIILVQDQMLKGAKKEDPALVIPGNLVVTWRTHEHTDEYIYPRIIRE